MSGRETTPDIDAARDRLPRQAEGFGSFVRSSGAARETCPCSLWNGPNGTERAELSPRVGFELGSRCQIVLDLVIDRTHGANSVD